MNNTDPKPNTSGRYVSSEVYSLLEQAYRRLREVQPPNERVRNEVDQASALIARSLMAVHEITKSGV